MNLGHSKRQKTAKRSHELRRGARDNSWELSDRVLLERMQASNEARAVAVALCENLKICPARRFGARKIPLIAGF